MNSYLTRLTPNFNNWRKPSGREGKCGSPEGPLYEGRRGFGWEEWLLNDYYKPNNQLDGYCYGFIQAFHKMNQAKAKIDRLYLYTKVCDGKSKSNYYLGYIDNVEVLKHPFTKKSLNDKKLAFCKKAEQDLQQLKITDYQNDLTQMCSEDTLYNVRFKPNDVQIKDFAFQIRPINMARGQARFKLYDLDRHANLINELNNYEKP
jgi:hypothetical protein